MRRGVILQGIGSDLPVGVAIALNSGVRAEQAEGEDVPRLFPLADWRSLTREQMGCLSNAGRAPLPEAVTVVEIDPTLRERFWAEIAPIACVADGASPEERRRCLWDFGHLVARNLHDRSGLRAASLRSCDVQVTPPRRESTGYDYRIGRHVGLHIDNHDRLPLGQRRGAFQLLCLNLGYAERHLNFVNLAVPGLLEAMGGAERDDRFPTGRHLLAAFFEAHPGYPVVRVTLPPDHAYIAVTQFVPHDGATNSHGEPDVAFLLGGYFEGADAP